MFPVNIYAHHTSNKTNYQCKKGQLYNSNVQKFV